MAYTKVKQAIIDGVMKRTDQFNEETFPQANPEWTKEQRGIWEFLNGESSGFMELHESHRKELRKNLSTLAGIEFESRFMLDKPIQIPPYTTIVFRKGVGSYAANFPFVASKISGLWSENGSGSSETPTEVAVKTLRPATHDEINSFFSSFPNSKLFKLFGAIEVDQDKFREQVIQVVTNITDDFFAKIRGEYPEGLTDKGRQILELLNKVGFGEEMRQVFSLIMEDPAMMKPYKPAPLSVGEFEPFTAIVPTSNKGGHTYTIDKVHIKYDGRERDIFFSHPDDGTIMPYGNHMDDNTSSFRQPTPDEIREYFTSMGADTLHLYASCLPEDIMKSLL